MPWSSSPPADLRPVARLHAARAHGGSGGGQPTVQRHGKVAVRAAAEPVGLPPGRVRAKLPPQRRRLPATRPASIRSSRATPNHLFDMFYLVGRQGVEP